MTANVVDFPTLQAAIQDYVMRVGDPDMTLRAPDFISDMELDFTQDVKCWQYEAMNTVVLGSSPYVPLPAGYFGMRRLRILAPPANFVPANPNVVTATNLTLTFATPDYISGLTADPQLSGSPRYYGIEAGQIILAPPNQIPYGQTMEMLFDQFFPLGVQNPTNWLILAYPDAYKFGALAFAADYIGDVRMEAKWRARYETIKERIRTHQRRTKHGGSPLVVRANAPYAP